MDNIYEVKEQAKIQQKADCNIVSCIYTRVDCTDFCHL